MKMSAGVLKHKVNILNSQDYRKDLAEIEKDLIKTVEEYETLLQYIQPLTSRIKSITLNEYLKDIGDKILDATEGVCVGGFGGLYGYGIRNLQGEILFRSYVLNITDEITTYAEDGLYPTTDEQKEYRNEILKGVIEAFSNFSYTK